MIYYLPTKKMAEPRVTYLVNVCRVTALPTTGHARNLLNTTKAGRESGCVYDFHWTGPHDGDRPGSSTLAVRFFPAANKARSRFRHTRTVCGWVLRLHSGRLVARAPRDLCWRRSAPVPGHHPANHRVLAYWQYDEFVSAANAWVDVREQWKRPVPRPVVPGPHTYVGTFYRVGRQCCRCSVLCSSRSVTFAADEQYSQPS